jgi:hypothetical protein
MAAFGHGAGIWLPHSTYAMLGSRHLHRISLSQARRGDLMFYGSGHVEINTIWYHQTFGAHHSGQRVGWRTWSPWWHPTAAYRVWLPRTDRAPSRSRPAVTGARYTRMRTEWMPACPALPAESQRGHYAPAIASCSGIHSARLTRPAAVSAWPASVLTDRAVTCPAANRPSPIPNRLWLAHSP